MNKLRWITLSRRNCLFKFTSNSAEVVIEHICDTACDSVMSVHFRLVNQNNSVLPATVHGWWSELIGNCQGDLSGLMDGHAFNITSSYALQEVLLLAFLKKLNAILYSNLTKMNI